MDRRTSRCVGDRGKSAASQKLPDVRLFPMRPFAGVSGNAILASLHKAQLRHPIRSVWDPALRLPRPLMEYVSAVCADLAPQIRQEAILLLKRYVWRSRVHREGSHPSSFPNLQVVALTCANLAMKHWQQTGIPEQQLHWLSRNSFTRQDFIDVEVEVMRVLGCIVHWEGTLLAEWCSLLVHLAEPLVANNDDIGILCGVAAHMVDVLAFRDEIMASHLPSKIAAATLHASVMLCTKHFQRYAFLLRIGHLCRAEEEQVVRLSEEILFESIGARCAEAILEGSGVTAEESDLEHDDDRPGNTSIL